MSINNSIAISASNLTKRFGDFTAVDTISFEVKTGRNLWFPWSQWSRKKQLPLKCSSG
jgi:ABC-type polar amino acid transport system ATPase subunit